MRRTNLWRHFAAVFLLCGLFNFAFSADFKVQRLIILGDSLSDNGNDYLATQRAHQVTSEVPIIPAPELYWNGRFSDGPIWADYLAGVLHFMPDSFAAEERSSKQYQNFAYGGAWAEAWSPNAAIQNSGNGAHLFPFPLNGQINNYLLRTRVDHPINAYQVLQQDMVLIWIGANDYLNQDSVGMPVLRSAEESTNAVVDAIRKGLVKLLQAGASHIVLLNLPDLGKTPYMHLRDPSQSLLIPSFSVLSALHNQKLQQVVTDLSQQYTDAQISLVDINRLFDDEYQEAAQRAEQYAEEHQGKFHKMIIPCILEGNDPDPAVIKFMPTTPILAMTAVTRARWKSSDTNSYRRCDLHEAEDQGSPYNFAENYTAGGIFFDHLHPLTQVHAKIAIAVCQHLQQKGLQLVKTDQSNDSAVDCNALSFDLLVRNIIEPPFPTYLVRT